MLSSMLNVSKSGADNQCFAQQIEETTSTPFRGVSTLRPNTSMMPWEGFLWNDCTHTHMKKGVSMLQVAKDWTGVQGGSIWSVMQVASLYSTHCTYCDSTSTEYDII
mmetsp:Transcript_16954/g.46921  ORF Transcript_16954/g.46921 Transcript_16954/m.46921 type:complete len:107 (-) Transcript_16954:27-347(-)